MARRVTGKIHQVNGYDSQRLYLKKDLTKDSAYPFRAGEPVRAQLVQAEGDKEVLLIVPETLEVDVDETILELQRSTQEVQVELEEGPDP